MKKIISIITMCTLIFTSMTFISTADTVTYKDAMTDTAAYIAKTDTNPQSGSEWHVIGLMRSGSSVVDNSYYSKYVLSMESYVKAQKGILDSRKYSEYSKVILAFTAMGRNASNIGGYNLLKKLADFDMVNLQGINGPTWALIALDSGNYKIPVVTSGKTQTTRDKLVDEILRREITGGGFALSESATEADCDITSMVLCALSKYADDENVKAAVERGISKLSEMQQDDGGFETYNVENSESIAQVIVALTTLGIDPASDSRFIKNGKSPLDALLSYYVKGNGFKHIEASASDGIATEQAYYALTAYDRFKNGKTALYKMSDIKSASKPSKVTLSSVKSLKAKSAVIKWKKLPSASGYQLRYSTNKKFSNSKALSVISTQKTLTGLKKGKTYYIKVRAYSKDANGLKIYGSYSIVKKVKII